VKREPLLGPINQYCEWTPTGLAGGDLRCSSENIDDVKFVNQSLEVPASSPSTAGEIVPFAYSDVEFRAVNDKVLIGIERAKPDGRCADARLGFVSVEFDKESKICRIMEFSKRYRQ
jgi:hypothetical protein